MGTRSTTKIYENGKLLLALYKQYDGHIESWGAELKQFLTSGQFVNGIPAGKTTGRIFNGMGDFALQLVTAFKTEVGGMYATTADDSQEYNYVIDYVYAKTPKGKAKIVLRCLEDKRFIVTVTTNECRYGWGE